IVLPVPGRPVDLQIRVSAPVSGRELPILLLSHGHGPSNYVSSLHGYAPLADYFAARGFVVIQPTHLDSKTLPFRSSDHPEAPLFWRSRVDDMKSILDQVEAIERAFPAIAGRVDPSKVAVAGHSMGGHTASVLLGAGHQEPRDGTSLRLADPRIRAGVLLAAPGRGSALSEYAAKHYPFFASIDFSNMAMPALVVFGDKDDSPFMKTAGAAWHADPYHLSPGPKSLLTVVGGEHGLGGVSGYDVAETTDEAPERVATVQRLTWAYLRSQFFGDSAWQEAQRALADAATPLARVESK
ncbi:MAG TPA: chlorophyllase, partial [Polyangiaceae bacterium]|nr:chlorophyllase [Polyangiaceae bacterium]